MLNTYTSLDLIPTQPADLPTDERFGCWVFQAIILCKVLHESGGVSASHWSASSLGTLVSEESARSTAHIIPALDLTSCDISVFCLISSHLPPFHLTLLWELETWPLVTFVTRSKKVPWLHDDVNRTCLYMCRRSRLNIQPCLITWQLNMTFIRAILWMDAGRWWLGLQTKQYALI